MMGTIEPAATRKNRCLRLGHVSHFLHLLPTGLHQYLEMPPKKLKKKVKTMHSRQKATTKSHHGRQGYEDISFDGEHRIVNGALIKRCEYYH